MFALFGIVFTTKLGAQSLSIAEVGTLKLSDVTTSSSINGKILVPALAENEGLLQIALGSKLQAFIQQYAKDGKTEIAIKLGLDIELITEKKSLLFPQETTFQVRFKGNYVGEQASSRPTIQVSGVPFFNTYKDVVRLYKQQVNSLILEIDKAPKMVGKITTNQDMVLPNSSKKISGKRKRFLWIFLTTSILGTAYLLSQDGKSSRGSDFPTPPNRPNN